MILKNINVDGNSCNILTSFCENSIEIPGKSRILSENQWGLKGQISEVSILTDIRLGILLNNAHSLECIIALS